MATLHQAVAQLRELACGHADGTDAELLRRFVRQRDEAAFETLVRRHGPLVLGVCRRLLPNAQDAEDAFQATFFLLARKAGSIRKPESLASWLHGVAHRSALLARKASARRRAREARAMPRREKTADTSAELREVLDHELAALPEKYRTAILLCDLQGKSHRQAACEVGCAEGTIASRLVRGRRLLAQRLQRRGLALSVGAIAGMLAQEALAAVPAPLVRTVLALAAGRATASTMVSTLMEGVLKMMLLNKLRSATAVVLLAGLLTAAGAMALGQDPRQPDVPEIFAQKPAKPPKTEPQLSDAEFIRKACLDLRGSLPTDIEVHYFLQDRNPQKRSWLVEMLQQEAARKSKTPDSGTVRFGSKARPTVEDEVARLQGEWEVVNLVRKGQTIAWGRPHSFRLVFEGDRVIFRDPARADIVKQYRVETERKPRAMHLTSLPGQADGSAHWSYVLNGDRLWIAIKQGGAALPSAVLDAPTEEVDEVIEFRRVRPVWVAPQGAEASAIRELMVNSRTFDLPFHVDQAQRASIAAIRLLVSADDGRNWRVDQQVTLDQSHFKVRFPQDGLYYFRVQVVRKDGTIDRSDGAGTWLPLRVRVNTGE